MNKYTSKELMKELKGKLRFGTIVRLTQTYGRLSKDDLLDVKKVYESRSHRGVDSKLLQIDPIDGGFYDEEVNINDVEIVMDAPKIKCPNCNHVFHFDIYKYEKLLEKFMKKLRGW